MMPFVRKLAQAVCGALLLALVLGLVLPRAWSVERTKTFAAPPERIAPFLVTLHRWPEWTVWNRELDPQLRNSFEGVESGPGARWSWLGPRMGRGRIVVVEADASHVLLDESIETEEVNGHARFTLTPVENGTRVTWHDEGRLASWLGGYVRLQVERELAMAMERSLTRLEAKVAALPPLVPVPPPLPPALPVDAGAPSSP